MTQKVMIKSNGHGISLVLSDQCPFLEVLEEAGHKMEEAKGFLESRLDITEEEISAVSSLPEVRSALVKEGVFYTYCPSCNAKLRLRSKGNYACPACKTKFFFNPIQEPMMYERISLE